MACSLEVKGESESNIGRIAPNMKILKIATAATSTTAGKKCPKLAF